MAGGMDLGGGTKGGKKPLDAAINLVPFIDLMAVTISFLIMTAVWSQAGRLQVSQAGGGSESGESRRELEVSLRIHEGSLALSVGGSANEPVPCIRDGKGRLDLVKLEAQLRELKIAQPEQQTITLQSDDSVRYEDLVRIIDGCIGAGLPSVQVSAG